MKATNLLAGAAFLALLLLGVRLFSGNERDSSTEEHAPAREQDSRSPLELERTGPRLDLRRGVEGERAGQTAESLVVEEPDSSLSLPPEVPEALEGRASPSGHSWADVRDAFRTALVEEDPDELVANHLWRTDAVMDPESLVIDELWSEARSRPLQQHERLALFDAASASRERILTAARRVTEQELAAREAAWKTRGYRVEINQGPPSTPDPKGAWKSGSSSLNGWQFRWQLFREDHPGLDREVTELDSAVLQQRRDVAEAVRGIVE